MFKKINKLNVILSVILFLTAVFFYFFAQDNNLENNNISKVCFENKCFDIEIVNTSEEREKGLMNRENLDLEKGMLFVFEKEGEYNFWMKNVLISLDIIWIDESKEIVFIKNNAEPCRTELCESFNPDKKAEYVLEVNGGMMEEMGIKIGDEVEFR